MDKEHRLNPPWIMQEMRALPKRIQRWTLTAGIRLPNCRFLIQAMMGGGEAEGHRERAVFPKKPAGLSGPQYAGTGDFGWWRGLIARAAGSSVRSNCRSLKIFDPLAAIRGLSNILILNTDTMRELAIVENNPIVDQTAFALFSDLISLLSRLDQLNRWTFHCGSLSV